MISRLDTMQHDSTNDYDILQQQIQSSLDKAQAQRNKLRTIDRRYSILGLILGATATFIAGQSAVANDPLIGNWRATATVASVITLGATITSGLQKQLADPDLLVETSECTAKLKALRIEMIAGTFDLEQVSEQYQQVLSEFSNVDC